MTEIPAALKDEIQGAYRHYLESKAFRPRYGQRLMIAEIVKGLLAESEAPAISVIEAGTGTGKTVAYLLAAIPLARQLDKRLVVSTATVALQEQIVLKDLPDLLRHSGLTFSFALAKGRGRYLCLAKLDQLLQQHDALDPNQPLYDDEQFLRLDERAHRLYQELGEAYVKGEWDGDRDNWPRELDESEWRPVTTDHRQCSNRRCSHFAGCCFFKAREGLDKADCVVANHDLVLSDLALGGGAILSEPEETLYIFDEGHHLADKAIQHFSARVRLEGSRNWIKQLPKTLARLTKELGNPDAVVRCLAPVAELLEGIDPLLERLDGLSHRLQQQVGAGDRDDTYYRFPDGVLPAELIDLAASLQRLYTRLVNQLDSLAEILKEAMSEPLIGIPREGAERWFAVVGQLQLRAEGALGLWRDYARAEQPAPVPQARWLTRLDAQAGGDTEFASSPILAADTLREHLWQRCFGAVVTSATLTALGRFDHLRLLTGLPEAGRYSRVPSPFDYQAARLCLPRLSAAPSEVEAHDRAVIAFLEANLAAEEAALVLFTSWRQMLGVRDGLGADLRARVLAQGDHSKQELLKRHRQAVDAGRGSVLFGLASFAEGVDLPGDYLKHVVIAKIPFGVPGHPVEAALHEWVRHRGGNPFMEISVPEASVRLIQACGRLLRSEQDSGRISILDTRLTSRQYGRALLDALPPFRRGD